MVVGWGMVVMTKRNDMNRRKEGCKEDYEETSGETGNLEGGLSRGSFTKMFSFLKQLIERKKKKRESFPLYFSAQKHSSSSSSSFFLKKDFSALMSPKSKGKVIKEQLQTVWGEDCLLRRRSRAITWKTSKVTLLILEVD